MSYKVKLSEFEGPLDLLLEIVEAKKFNVLNLSLSSLASEFLAYLRQLPEKNIAEIASFIAVGARLALLKSRELVPSLIEEEEGAQLEKQIALYHPYRSAAKKLETLSRSKKRYYSREAFISHPPVFSFPKSLTKNSLVVNILNVLGSINHASHIPQAYVRETLSIEECIEHLIQVMHSKERLDFNEFLKEKNEQDHVVHFIGLLELVRAGRLEARQKIAFGTIEISSYGI